MKQTLFCLLVGLIVLGLFTGSASAQSSPLRSESVEPQAEAPAGEAAEPDAPTDNGETAAPAEAPDDTSEASETNTEPDAADDAPPAAAQPEDGAIAPVPAAGNDGLMAPEPPAEPAESQPETDPQAQAEAPEDNRDTAPLADTEDDDMDEPQTPPTPADDSLPGKSRVRLTLSGAVSAPATGEDIGFGLGGFVAYDLWDKLGFELFLMQVWSKTTFDDGTDVSAKILQVKPGARFRFMNWNNNALRVYVAAHLGLVQTNWTRPSNGFSQYQEGFGFDGGLGIEYRFAKIVIVDAYVLYEAGLSVMPTTDAGDYRTYHGVLGGIAIGISSHLD